jgi:hypothetical protein
MAVLNVFKLVFKVDNSFGLMVEGGGWWSNGARRAQEGKAGHGGLGVAVAQAWWRHPTSAGGRRRGRGPLRPSGL